MLRAAAGAVLPLQFEGSVQGFRARKGQHAQLQSTGKAVSVKHRKNTRCGVFNRLCRSRCVCGRLRWR